MKNRIGLSAKKIALVAVMTATIEGAKMALAAIPNVEAVTLLCAVYGYVFGGLGILSTSLFVLIETFIYPIHSWVIYYAIHWNAICLTFWILGKKQIGNRIVITFFAFLHTAFFGVESSLVDTLLFAGVSNFWEEFAALYVRGIWFYVTEVVCNLFLFPIAFLPLTKVLFKAKERFFAEKKKQPSPTEPPKREASESTVMPWDKPKSPAE